MGEGQKRYLPNAAGISLLLFYVFYYFRELAAFSTKLETSVEWLSMTR